MRFSRALLACALLASCALAQRPLPEVRVSASAYRLPPPVLRAQTSLVTLDVVVRSRDGSLLPGLTRYSFRVEDNGQPRALASFSVQSQPAAATPATAAAPVAPSRSPVSGAAPPPPRAIALYFDDVNTDKAALGEARNAAERFVREALRPGDRVAVFTASSQESFDFSADPARLQAAIARIEPHPRASASGVGTCPRISPYQAYLIVNHLDPSALDAAMAEKKACDVALGIVINDGTQSYIKGIPGTDNDSEQVISQSISTWDMTRAISTDTLASEEGVVEYLARQPGSRMLLMASGGFLAGTLEQQQDDIIQAALRAGVVINALDAKGLYTDGPGRPIDETPDLPELPLPTYFFEETSKLSQRQSEDAAMANLAESTGGLFFHDDNDLTVGFHRLGVVPALAYEMAFSAGDIPRDGKYHKLKVELVPARAGAIIQARPGYFAPSPTAPNATPQQQMEAALRTAVPLDDLAASVLSRPLPGKVAVDLQIDLQHLRMANEKGRRRQDLHFLVGLFDAHGAFVVGKQAEMDLALTPATWDRLLAQGLSANLSLSAPPGAYQLRVVVEEASDGKLFATSQPALIPNL